ncbi:MAG: T9SS type A sorting domain-containing protein [Paludibacter sp.]|nr:T9SS type A sorting domain-containing protein [Paludibacter sp.]
MKNILSILLFLTIITYPVRVFAGEISVSANESPEKENVIAPKVFVSGGILHIQNVDDGAKVEIYSIVGIKVKTVTLTDGVVDVSDLNKGIYIVRVDKTSQKIVIQ